MKTLKASKKRLEDALKASKASPAAGEDKDRPSSGKRKEEESPRATKPEPKNPKASHLSPSSELVDVDKEDLQTAITRCVEDRLQAILEKFQPAAHQAPAPAPTWSQLQLQLQPLP